MNAELRSQPSLKNKDNLELPVAVIVSQYLDLVDEYLESGLLVRATDLALTTESQFYLLEHNQDDQRTTKAASSAFRQWLLKEVGK